MRILRLIAAASLMTVRRPAMSGMGGHLTLGDVAARTVPSPDSG
jgi:hypothetical protein